MKPNQQPGRIQAKIHGLLESQGNRAIDRKIDRDPDYAVVADHLTDTQVRRKGAASLITKAAAVAAITAAAAGVVNNGIERSGSEIKARHDLATNAAEAAATSTTTLPPLEVVNAHLAPHPGQDHQPQP